MRINPKDADVWLSLGSTYRHLDRYGDAIEAYRQVLRIDPKNVEAWLFLGSTYIISGNKSAAMEVVQKLRRLDPAKADILFNLIVPR